MYYLKYMNNLFFTINNNNFLIRPLHYNDITENYIKMLKQLTKIDNLNKEKTINFIQSLNENHSVFIIEDYKINKIIGSGTIYIENKLIHNNGKVGHIEDIVIEKKYRHYGLGKKLINFLTEYAKNKNCYKCILDCSENNVIFYEKCNYERKGIEMAIYF